MHCQVPISFTQAALGGELEVPTLDGKVKLRIPLETQTGSYFDCVEKECVRSAGARSETCFVGWWAKHQCVCLETPSDAIEKNYRTVLLGWWSAFAQGDNLVRGDAGFR
ncbi:MAG: hypothetical protein CM1200mP9_05740 [Gammaproteobacteria bacterium]|nr:MAG: hypothetical protein CM1200mP9_05740 [Gammaproteobacteria bacterium]